MWIHEVMNLSVCEVVWVNEFVNLWFDKVNLWIYEFVNLWNYEFSNFDELMNCWICEFTNIWMKLCHYEFMNELWI